MSAPSWLSPRASALRQLSEACPPIANHAGGQVVQSIVTIMALSRAAISARLRDNLLEVELHVRPAPDADAMARDLLDRIADVVSDRARKSRSPSGPDLGTWLEEQGFTILIGDLLSADASEANLAALAELAALAVRVITARTEELGVTHLQDVLSRDIPQALFIRRQLTPVAEWLLAPEMSSKPRRAEILKRRLQAIQLYGALSLSLREPDITEAVDTGAPLAPALIARHDLALSELRCLRGSRKLRAAIENTADFRIAVEELKAHCVPRHEWPGEGRPGAHEEWEVSQWVKGGRAHLIRPDYVGDPANGVQDALNALRDDLLRPLVAERIAVLKLPHSSGLDRVARSLEFETKRLASDERRCFMAGIRATIVGRRGAKAFREAVVLWHRRAASLSALRHERHADRPGWPALCQPWRSPCGRYGVVALSSAADLVEEGNQLRHCVGGYYEICRRGDTQILSLRRDGIRSATVEITLNGGIETPLLEVGQFHARGNTRPAEDFHDALRAFLRDLRSGDHPMNAAGLARYRRRMQKTGDYAWRSEAMPLVHAREVFSLYRPLLPRGAPAEFDAWCAASGLAETIDAALRAMERWERPRVAERNSH